MIIKLKQRVKGIDECVLRCGDNIVFLGIRVNASYYSKKAAGLEK